MINIRLLDPDNSTVIEHDDTVLEVKAGLAGFIGQYRSIPDSVFAVDEINITQRAYETIGSVDAVIGLLHTHFLGRWSSMPDEDKRANDASIKAGRGFIYDWPLHKGTKLLIVSAIGQYTTVMLPSEY